MAQIRPLRIVNDGVSTSKEHYKAFSLISALLNEVKADLNTLRTQSLIASGVKTSAGLAIGSTKSRVANVAFGFQITGLPYYKAAVAAGTAPAAEAIPQAKYGLWKFEIGADGTIDVLSAAANTTGYATEALAIAALPATSTSHVEIGYVTVMKSDGAFTGATTNFDATNVTTAYYSSAILTSAVALADIDLTNLGV